MLPSQFLVNPSYQQLPVQCAHNVSQFSFPCVTLNFIFFIYTCLWDCVLLARDENLLGRWLKWFNLCSAQRRLLRVSGSFIWVSVLIVFLFLTACQCNGHSKCVNESICEKCENLTTGRHCETCISGYYGDPTNGGTCQRKCCLRASCTDFSTVFTLCSFLCFLNTNYILITHVFFPAGKLTSCFFKSKTLRLLSEIVFIAHKDDFMPSFLNLEWPQWKMPVF